MMAKEIELKLEVPPQELRRLRPPVAKVAEASQIGCHDWSPNGSGDFDRARLFQFRARYEEREHAIAVLGANAVRVDLDRDGDRAVDTPRMRSRLWTLASSWHLTSFLPAIRIAFSLASMCRSLLATPGSSTTKTKSPPAGRS